MNALPEVMNEVKRKARKNHTCCDCKNTISIGETYAFTSGIWDGSPDSFKQCLTCSSIATNFLLMDKNILLDEGPYFGGLGEWLQEFLCSSWNGMEAADEIAKTFSVPLEHIKLLLRIRS